MDARPSSVSVIILVYNGKTFIEEALASLLAQTFNDFEIIVINVGSTEGTGARLEKYRDQMNCPKRDKRPKRSGEV